VVQDLVSVFTTKLVSLLQKNLKKYDAEMAPWVTLRWAVLGPYKFYKCGSRGYICRFRASRLTRDCGNNPIGAKQNRCLTHKPHNKKCPFGEAPRIGVYLVITYQGKHVPGFRGEPGAVLCIDQPLTNGDDSLEIGFGLKVAPIHHYHHILFAPCDR
jgi:hypothetical protein